MVLIKILNKKSPSGINQLGGELSGCIYQLTVLEETSMFRRNLRASMNKVSIATKYLISTWVLMICQKDKNPPVSISQLGE